MVPASAGAGPNGGSAAPGGSVYFVSPTGVDSNPGTESLPWATLDQAADSLYPGDLVYVRGGILYGAEFDPRPFRHR